MTIRFFNFAAVCSAATFCLLVVAWMIADRIDPRQQFVSLSRGCHLSIDGRADARLWIFNDSRYGPYRGSIIGFAGDLNGPKVSGFDAAGIYYRLFRWPNGSSWWTLSLSLLYPLILASLLPLVWIVRRSQGVRRGFPVDEMSSSESIKG